MFEEQGGFDLVVGNPPWGADLSEIRAYLDGGPFTLARGQYDSYELFIELGRRLLREGGDVRVHHPRQHHAAGARAVAPHVAGPNRVDAAGAGGRRHFSFRLPRRVLPLFCQPAPAARNSGSAWRHYAKTHRRLLEEDTLFQRSKTIAEIVEENGHDVEQSRFRANPRYEVDILAKGPTRPLWRGLTSRVFDWESMTEKGRGVEIGKSGEVLQCPYCYQWDNVPRKVKGAWRRKSVSPLWPRIRLRGRGEARNYHRRQAAGKTLETDHFGRGSQPLFAWQYRVHRHQERRHQL